MAEPIPTTDEVRRGYATPRWGRYDGRTRGTKRLLARFDRWLASVKAEAWEEGFDLATRNSPLDPHPMRSDNPYRESGGEK